MIKLPFRRDSFTRAPSWWLVQFFFQGLFCSFSYANIFLHSNINHDDFPIANPPAIITLGAYYYPWHLRHFQVTREGYLRKLLEARQEIRLGEYDDTQPQVIQQHLDWSHQANIKVWISSWWGPGSGTDNTLRNFILPHPGLENHNHKIALLYETTGRIKQAEEYDPWRVDGDIEYICDVYVDHPNYYRINGRPVLVVYLTRLLENRGVLDIVMEKIRDACPELYVIGDHVWGDPPERALDQLDAITNYDIYGNIGRPRHAGQSRVDSYYAEAANWKNHAKLHNASFVPSVSPGYNDRGVRLLNDHRALSRRLTETSSEGSLLAAQLVKAIQLLDPDADHLLLVNSFNEWHEDTQIEPCDGKPATNPRHLTQNLEYVGYGTLYLDILSHYTRPVDPPTVPENPIYYSGEPYATANLAAFYFSWFTDEDYGRGVRANLLPTGQLLQSPMTSDKITQDLWISWQGNIKTWYVVSRILKGNRGFLRLLTLLFTRFRILPWNRPNHATDSGASSVFSNPYLVGSTHQVALHYHVHFRVDDQLYDGAFLDTTLVSSDIEYLCDNYLAHDRYYRTSNSNKPILFMGLARVLFNNGALELVVDAIREAASSKGLDLFLVGDHIWGEVPLSSSYQPFSVLDAVVNFDVYGNMGEPSGYAGQATINEYYEQQRRWRIESWKQGCSFVPTVIPGYNDRALRLSNNNPALSRRLEANDPDGTFFSESLDKAQHLLDSELDNIIVLNSFNHFSEDTQIYPVHGLSTNLPSNLTEGLTYDGYENLYLNLLANRFGSYPRPSEVPSMAPSLSVRPSNQPSESVSPSSPPSSHPSAKPSQSSLPSSVPTYMPSNTPSLDPSPLPSSTPSLTQSSNPTAVTLLPSNIPSANSSSKPSFTPSRRPSMGPSKSVSPSATPSAQTLIPSYSPSFEPSLDPTAIAPDSAPPSRPSSSPPSSPPSLRSSFPSTFPSSVPSVYSTSDNGSDLLTIEPSSTPSALVDQCQNDEGWKTYRANRDDYKGCIWVAQRPINRCRREGTDSSLGFESCLASCRCFGENCVDDESWLTLRNGNNKPCDWVARKPESRCRSRGIDSRRSYAFEKCKAACSCPF